MNPARRSPKDAQLGPAVRTCHTNRPMVALNTMQTACAVLNHSLEWIGDATHY
jgi:hypothetical protein